MEPQIGAHMIERSAEPLIAAPRRDKLAYPHSAAEISEMQQITEQSNPAAIHAPASRGGMGVSHLNNLLHWLLR